MSSTILSSLGEPIRHANSLATVTYNWIVVREAPHKQSLVLIDNIAAVQTFKTNKMQYVACAFGCLIVASATIYSKEAYGVTLPFVAVGIVLLASAQLTRRASIAFVVDNEIVQTAYGSLREAATLVAAIRSAKEGWRRADQPIYAFYSWVRVYLTLLV